MLQGLQLLHVRLMTRLFSWLIRRRHDDSRVEDVHWKTDPAEVSKSINAAPACGLCLNWVKCPNKNKKSPSTKEPEQS
jgi:tRNA U38,U39,U40 pseudouridine synthase TruA